MAASPESQTTARSLRWWPGVLLVLGMFIAVAWVRAQEEWPFQKRNLTTAQIGIVTGMLLVGWWTFFSRAPNRLRLTVTFGLVWVAALGALLFRVRGMSGDMLPIIEFRWQREPVPQLAGAENSPGTAETSAGARPDFPQFLGPNRDGVLPGPRLATNWTTQPPQLIWRQPVGAAWSGFAVVGEWAITQEQAGEAESITAYRWRDGQRVWRHTYSARFNTVIAGEGPRATPTIVGDRVYAAGGTGMLFCLDLASGREIWSRDVIATSGGKVPMWGYASAPLVVADLVIVHGGEGASQSLYAFQCADGTPVWAAGMHDGSYASPRTAPLAGRLQILAFNNGSVSGHDPQSGRTLWERSWGNGNVVCAPPVVVSSNRVVFSSGYGVGAELLEISPVTSNRMSATLVWKSIRMKSKFAHWYVRAEHLFGLDDGIFACVALADGGQKWKEGRYGHGQGLAVGEHYVLMSEAGELVLLQPTPEAPNELARFRVFQSKTWNPPALVGDVLLLRNDREAVALRLPTAP